MTTDSPGTYQPDGASQPFGSTATTAQDTKDHAAQLGQTAKDKGAEVASTAADQAKNVAGEASHQAKALLQETQTQVREQAGTQKDKAAGGLRGISDELRSLADGTTGETQSGMVTDFARQASDKVQEIAGWLESKEPGELLDEIRSLARRKPGSFLLGAAVAGVAAGRLTRGAVDTKREESGATPSYDRPSTPAYASSAPQPTGTPYAGTAPAPDLIIVEDAVVVETDPFGANPQRSTVGGGRL